jgi:hypothetical protein
MASYKPEIEKKNYKNVGLPPIARKELIASESALGL